MQKYQYRRFAWFVTVAACWSALQCSTVSAAPSPINLQAPRSVPARYIGDPTLVNALGTGSTVPLTMVVDDFDADGAQDLVVGYSSREAGGFLAIQRGNVDAFSPRDTAVFSAAHQGHVADSLLPDARVIAVPGRPDFLVSGDFDGDGRRDLLVAERGGGLWLLPGDGRGEFETARLMTLYGGVTALAAGRFGAGGGATDVLVGVNGPGGPAVLAFTAAFGGMFGSPIEYPMPAEPIALAMGDLDADSWGDAAVAAGHEVIVIHGSAAMDISPETRLERVPLPFEVRSIALGDFVADRLALSEIAALGDNGAVQILQRSDLDSRPLTAEELQSRRASRLRATSALPNPWQPNGADAWKIGPTLHAAPVADGSIAGMHISAASSSEVLLLDRARQRLEIASPGQGGTTLDLHAKPLAVAVLPTRLDGAREMVALTSRGPKKIHQPASFTITVDRNDDTAAASSCTAAANDCSLRGAVIFANANPGTTIDVPAGTYQLTIDGSSESGQCRDATIGDLDIAGNNTTITGAGSGNTIIQQTKANDRVMCVNQFLVPSFTFTMSGVTITGGRETFGVGGAGVVSGNVGDSTSYSDVAFTNNQASGGGSPVGGGLGHSGGNLSCSGCVFGAANPPGASQTDTTLANESHGSGGGAYVSANYTNCVHPCAGTYTISDSTFLNSVSSAGNGGGLITTAGNSYTVSNSTFTGNQAGEASARGGGIYDESGSITITYSTFLNNQTTGATGGGGGVGAADGGGQDVSLQYSRLVGNTSAVPTGGNQVHGSNMSAFTATENWWGQATGPATNDAVNATTSPWITMTNTPSPSTINGPGGFSPNSTTLTASVLKDSNGGALTTTQVALLLGLPVTWSNAQLGTLSGQQTAIQSNGTATATFTAGSTGGTGHADVKLDNGTVTANITVNEKPTVTTPSTDQTACSGSSVSFTAAATGPPTPTVQWQVSTNNGGTWNDIGSATSGTYTHTAQTSENNNQYRAVFTNSAGTTNSSAATLTVNVAPSVGTNPQSQTVNVNDTVTFTASATGTPTPSVKWQVSTNNGGSWSDIPSANSTTLQFSAQASDNGHQFRAVFTNTCSVVPTSAATLTVNSQFTLNTTVSPPGSGSIGLNPPTQPYDPGTPVQMTFTAAVCYQFASWSGDFSSTNNPDTVTMNANKNVTGNAMLQTTATDVTSQTGVVASGFASANGYFWQTLQLTNNSGSTINGPVTLAFDGLTAGVTVVGAGGTTLCTSPAGSQWLTISAGPWTNGQTLTVTVQYADPGNARIRYTRRVLTGNGVR